MRILFVTSRPPWPSRRGDQARTAGFVAELAARHEIAVLAQRPPGFRSTGAPPGVALREVALGPLRRALNLPHVATVPAQVALHRSGAFREQVAAHVRSFRPDVAVVVLSRLGEVLDALGNVPTVVDFIDSLALNMDNRARRDKLLAPLWRWEGARMRRWEQRILRSVERGLVVSERDRVALLEGTDDPALAAKLEVVRFGIVVPPLDIPRPSSEPTVLLSGNLGYFPTVEGACWFAREVWPRIRAARPETRWILAGSRPAAKIRALAELPGVRLDIDPPDLEPFLRLAQVAIAPLRAGSGVPIKILEAMARGLPVATTSAAADGLDGAPDGAVAVADDPDAFAAAVLDLLDAPERAARQAESARLWVSEVYGLTASARRFEALLEEIVLERGGRSA